MPESKRVSKNKASELFPESRPGVRQQRLTESLQFTIASQGHISNMEHSRSKYYISFVNSGAGDCLFESFRRFLHLPDTVMGMRRDMVNRLKHASEEIRGSQLNEHIHPQVVPVYNR